MPPNYAKIFRYGGRATTTECPSAIVVMCVQSVIGIFIEVTNKNWMKSLKVVKAKDENLIDGS